MRELKKIMLGVFVILCIMGWSLVPQSKSMRAFQDIEIRLPKLFILNFAGKMMDF